MEEFVSGLKASEILGVHQRTLYLWDKKKIINTIRTPGGKRLYNVKKYLNSIEKNKSNVSYVNNPSINNKFINKNNYIYMQEFHL
jgi:predicted site-specific integrase-resolvase